MYACTYVCMLCMYVCVYVYMYVDLGLAVALYNSVMGGKDLADQLCLYIHTSLRSNKWPVRIFTHLFTLTVTNVHILYVRQHSRA
jgi:hypothetical protein